MSRLTFIWFTLHLLHVYFLMTSVAQDLSQIKPAIEKERQIVRIRNKILKELESSGAKISRSDILTPLEQSDMDGISGTEDIKSHVRVDIATSKEAETKPKALVTLGEPVSKEEDKCLAFHIQKYVKDVESIVPKKIDLWIHIRKLERGNKKKHAKDRRMFRAGLRTDNDNLNKDTKKKKRKDKKKRKGRRIKIFISNGKKTLVKMRMRIKKTKWYKIELPISHFPEVIKANHSFKLCFKCKRCSKRIKLDLYKKGIRQLNPPDADSSLPDQPTIPFIHFEEHRSHHTNRFKRSTSLHISHKTYTPKQLNTNKKIGYPKDKADDACCREQTYTEEISKVFPSIVHPETINITLCKREEGFGFIQPLLSQNSASPKYVSIRKCVPIMYKSLEFTYITNNLSIKHAVIPHLIPVGCTCTELS